MVRKKTSSRDSCDISAGIDNRNWEEVLSKCFEEGYDTFMDILARETRDNTPIKKELWKINQYT